MDIQKITNIYILLSLLSMMDRGKRTRKRNKEFILNYKKDKECEICGYNEHTEILQFHHKDDNKSKGVSDMSSSGNYCIKRILEEIEKCALLCPNCHMWIHFR